MGSRRVAIGRLSPDVLMLENHGGKFTVAGATARGVGWMHWLRTQWSENPIGMAAIAVGIVLGVLAAWLFPRW